MKVSTDLTLNGHNNPAIMAGRLRELADVIEATDAAMQSLGSSPPSIPGGGNLVFGFQVEATVNP